MKRPNDTHGSRIASYGRHRTAPLPEPADDLTELAMTFTDLIAAYRAGTHPIDHTPAEPTAAPTPAETITCTRCHDPLRHHPKDGLCPTCRRITLHPAIRCERCERETTRPGLCGTCRRHLKEHQ